ncbi:MAG: D-2-hydroxyacid dehydrogenase [bacterium]|nr:D-2-hydroxyacid dehydrogenase [bacterium]
MSDDLRLLVLAEDPDVVVSAIESRFSGLQMTTVADFDMLGEAIASDPHVAYTERFKPGPFPRDILFSQPSLRFVHASGVGVNHLVPWDPAQVVVCNSAGVQDEAMAQFAIARLIAMTCHFFRYHDQQKQRIWKGHDALRSTGGTLTVVGLGRIGKACARIAGALGMTVHGVKARVEAVPGVSRVVRPEDINDVLCLSDYVIIVTPLTEATRGLIGEKAIAAMKPGVMIHNMSRGGVVDEAALVDALESGHVRAASLDVFETEPLPATSILWEMENVHITPHNGIMMTWEDYIHDAIEVFLANLDRYINGIALKNVVDPSRGY